jgi:N-terminal domain of anti-restriction factor ArdC
MSRQHLDRAARDARIEALQNQLATSVSALVSGEDWRRALEFAARFRSRSFSNTMLIYVQHHKAFEEGRVPEPTPTYVAGFKQWLSLDRHVMKGQTGYAILAPVTARFASSTPENAESWRRLARGEGRNRGESVRSKLVGVKPAHVWDPLSRDFGWSACGRPVSLGASGSCNGWRCSAGGCGFECLAGVVAVLAGFVQRPGVALQHATEDGQGALLRLGVAAAQTDQPAWAVLAGGQRADVGAHVSKRAARGGLGPLGLGRSAVRRGSVDVGVEAAHGLAVVGDELVGVELGVDHHRVDRGVPEQRLDHMDRGVGVEVLRCEHAPAVVRGQDQLGAVCVLGASLLRDPAEPAADGVGVDRAGMADALQQVGRSGAGVASRVRRAGRQAERGRCRSSCGRGG